jgi:hypothetical protein
MNFEFRKKKPKETLATIWPKRPNSRAPPNPKQPHPWLLLSLFQPPLPPRPPSASASPSTPSPSSATAASFLLFHARRQALPSPVFLSPLSSCSSQPAPRRFTEQRPSPARRRDPAPTGAQAIPTEERSPTRPGSRALQPPRPRAGPRHARPTRLMSRPAATPPDQDLDRRSTVRFPFANGVYCRHYLPMMNAINDRLKTPSCHSLPSAPLSLPPIIYKSRRRVSPFSLPQSSPSFSLPQARPLSPLRSRSPESTPPSRRSAHAHPLSKPCPRAVAPPLIIVKFVAGPSAPVCRSTELCPCLRSPEQRPARYRASSETCPNPVKPRCFLPVEPFTVIRLSQG